MIGAGWEGTQHALLGVGAMSPVPERQEASWISKVNHAPVALRAFVSSSPGSHFGSVSSSFLTLAGHIISLHPSPHI